MNKQIKKWQKKFRNKFFLQRGSFRTIEGFEEVEDFLTQAIQESVVEVLESLRMERIPGSKEYNTPLVDLYDEIAEEQNQKIDKLTK